MAQKPQKILFDPEKFKIVFFSKDRKSILFLVIATAAAIFCAVFVLYYTQLPKAEEKSLLRAPTQEELLQFQQLGEVDALREEARNNLLTEEEITQQTNEVDALREEAALNPLSEEEIQRQLEEVDRLRQAELDRIGQSQ